MVKQLGQENLRSTDHSAMEKSNLLNKQQLDLSIPISFSTEGFFKILTPVLLMYLTSKARLSTLNLNSSKAQIASGTIFLKESYWYLSMT